MTNKLVVLILSTMLASCANVSPTIENVSTPAPKCVANTDADIIRCANGLTATVESKTATSESMATHNAYSTEARGALVQSTQDAVEYQITQLAQAIENDRATSISFAQSITNTQTADKATQIAAQITSSALDATKTSTAQVAINAQATQAQAIDQNNNYEWQQTTRQTINAIVMSILAIIVLAIACSYILFRVFINYRVIQLEKNAEQDRMQQQTEHEIKMANLRIDGLSKAMRRHGSSVITFLPDGRTLTLPGVDGPVENSSLVSDLPPVDSITINAGDDSYSVPAYTEREQQAIDSMVELLQAAIAYHASKKTVGIKARQIPRYNHIGWSPNKWVEVKGLFGDAVQSGPGAANGTYPSDDNQSLADLLHAVRFGKVHPLLVENVENKQ